MGLALKVAVISAFKAIASNLAENIRYAELKCTYHRSTMMQCDWPIEWRQIKGWVLVIAARQVGEESPMGYVSVI